MRCIHCNRQIPDRATICAHCGYPQMPPRSGNPRQSGNLRRGAYPPQRSAPPNSQEPSGKRKPLGLVIPLALLAVLAVTGGLIALVWALTGTGSGHRDRDPVKEIVETEMQIQNETEPETESEIETEPSAFETDQEICAGISELVSPYLDEDGYFAPDEGILTEAAQKVYNWAQGLEREGKIEGAAICEEGYSVSFFLWDGTTTVYLPSIREYYAGNEDICIGMIDVIPPGDKILNDIPYHNPADTITGKISTATSKEFGAGMTLTDLKAFLAGLNDDKVRAIFWRGHGSLFQAQNGTDTFAFCIREKVTAEKEKQYEEERRLPEDGSARLVHTYGGLTEYYAITWKYFETYLPSVEGGLFFACACYSHADGGKMADTFIQKGFDAYVGSSTSISISYANAVMSDTAKYLAEQDEGGVYTDIETALGKAVDDNNTNGFYLLNDKLGSGGRFELVYSRPFRLIEKEPDPSFTVTLTSSDGSVGLDHVSVKCLKIDANGMSQPYERVNADELINGRLRIEGLEQGDSIRLDLSYDGYLLKSVTYENYDPKNRTAQIDLKKVWLDFRIIDGEENAIEDAKVEVWGAYGSSGTNGLIQTLRMQKNESGETVYRLPVEPGRYSFKVTPPERYHEDPVEDQADVLKNTLLTYQFGKTRGTDAYADVVREYEDRYGKLTFLTPTEAGLTSEYYIGVFLIRLIDFDGDGIQELLIGYAQEHIKNGISWPMLDLWRLEQGTPELVYEGAIITHSDVGSHCEFTRWNGTYYLVCGHDGSGVDLQFLAMDRAGRMREDMTLECPDSDYQWRYNGQIVTDEEGMAYYEQLQAEAVKHHGAVLEFYGETKESIRAALEDGYAQLGM